MIRKRKERLLVGLLLLLLMLCMTTGALAKTKAGGLTYGDRGEDVQRVQQALEILGYKPGKVDGTFGAYTENALRKFQKAHGLAVDGIAGTKTREMLFELAEGKTTNQTAAAVAQPAPATETSTAVQTAVTQSDGSFFGGNYATLRSGETGTRVILLQNALMQLGYSCGQIDGKYGSGTENAVIAFQKANQLTADGIAGKKTLQKMESLRKAAARQTAAAASAPAVQPAGQELSVGMSGSEVTDLQQKLKALGHYTGTVDGVYGDGTRNAVIAFQTAQGLLADGVAGSKTRSALSAAILSLSQPQATTAPENSYRTLKKGTAGADVTSLQTALLRLSYSVQVTGTFDDVTRAAVQAFQKRNSLTVDGVAGKATQTRLYAGNAVAADVSSASSNASNSSSAAPAPASSGPAGSEIKLLHWFNDIKPTLKTGQTILIYDPATRLSWNLRLYSLGRHADSEPLTAEDTATMVKAFGNTNTWNQKAVYVRLPSGVWTVGSTHDMPHLSGSIKDNNFNGHLCVHFLRDMSETQKNDPKYGVANQETIRNAWKALTGEVLSY